MKHSKTFAMLTGPSKVGKSTLARQLLSDLNCLGQPARVGMLVSDEEIACRSFKILNRLDLCADIGHPEKLLELSKNFDLDRLYRLHHRDWVARNYSFETIVAEGWLYMSRHHRRQVYDGLKKLPDCSWRFVLILLWPENRVDRYLSRKEVKVCLAGRTDTQKRDHANKCLGDDYQNWQEPSSDEPVIFRKFDNDEGVKQFFRDGFKNPAG